MLRKTTYQLMEQEIKIGKKSLSEMQEKMNAGCKILFMQTLKDLDLVLW